MKARGHSRHRKLFIALTLLCILSVALYLAREPILNGIAHWLVERTELKQSDAIVVLVGDVTGDRLLGAIDLLKKGYGGYILFWGGQVYWKYNLSEYYLRLMKENGISPDKAVFSEQRLAHDSTKTEALSNMKLLKERGARSFILVTSHYHTRRAAAVYRPLAAQAGMTMSVYPIEDTRVTLDGWWRDRESAKNVVLELEKTLWYKISSVLH